MIRQRTGEPKLLVTLYFLMASTIFWGLTLAGLEGFISGMMVVMPRAGLKRAKMGSMGRSTSPAWMLKDSLINLSWASKIPWV